MNNKAELMPCPFCGGEARIRYESAPYVDNYYDYYVACDDCKTRTSLYHAHIDVSSGARKQVSEQWNTRKGCAEVAREAVHNIQTSDIKYGYLIRVRAIKAINKAFGVSDE
ncbi:MAG: Lar family restriction alleviation protein [Gammaproteobacteria bacterium]|nr:Lar family restriction alleviation protein [Gammaproteobacteria bacterium]